MIKLDCHFRLQHSIILLHKMFCCWWALLIYRFRLYLHVVIGKSYKKKKNYYLQYLKRKLERKTMMLQQQKFHHESDSFASDVNVAYPSHLYNSEKKNHLDFGCCVWCKTVLMAIGKFCATNVTQRLNNNNKIPFFFVVLQISKVK